MRRVIVDVDVGVDDFLAILLLLYAEKKQQIKIEAIICTMGNADVEDVCKNVLKLLEITRRTDIPVYKGAKKQLLPLKDTFTYFHGKNGMGGLKYDTEPDLSGVKSEPAAVALYEFVKKYPGEIDLICLAPLTNIALAARIYDDFMGLVKSVNIMGGNNTGVGNATGSAEFNFFVDPEAAHIVLNTVKCPTKILPWETCRNTKFTSDWRYNVLAQIKNPAFELVTRAEKLIPWYNSGSEWWETCDALLVMAYLYPEEGVIKASEHNATVELHGLHTRGQLVLDHLKINAPNVTILECVNEKLFMDIMCETAKTVK